MRQTVPSTVHGYGGLGTTSVSTTAAGGVGTLNKAVPKTISTVPKLTPAGASSPSLRSAATTTTGLTGSLGRPITAGSASTTTSLSTAAARSPLQQSLSSPLGLGGTATASAGGLSSSLGGLGGSGGMQQGAARSPPLQQSLSSPRGLGGTATASAGLSSSLGGLGSSGVTQQAAARSPLQQSLSSPQGLGGTAPASAGGLSSSLGGLGGSGAMQAAGRSPLQQSLSSPRGLGGTASAGGLASSLGGSLGGGAATQQPGQAARAALQQSLVSPRGLGATATASSGLASPMGGGLLSPPAQAGQASSPQKLLGASNSLSPGSNPLSPGSNVLSPGSDQLSPNTLATAAAGVQQTPALTGLALLHLALGGGAKDGQALAAALQPSPRGPTTAPKDGALGRLILSEVLNQQMPVLISPRGQPPATAAAAPGLAGGGLYGAMAASSGSLGPVDLQMPGGTLDPTQPAMSGRISQELGFPGAKVEKLSSTKHAVRGGLNAGVWVIKDTGRGDIVLKAVAASRGEGERFAALVKQFPSIATDRSLAFPIKLFNCLDSSGSKKFDLVAMYKAPGRALGDWVGSKWYRKQHQLLFQVLEKVGLLIGEVHARYGGKQHGDFQPSNIFYDEDTDKLTIIDLSDLGLRPKADADHFQEALKKISAAYGQSFLADAVFAFEAGYARSPSRRH